MIMLQLNTLLLLFYFCLNSLLSFGLHCGAQTFRGSWFQGLPPPHQLRLQLTTDWPLCRPNLPVYMLSF
jgi:hypothetical protein